MVNSLEELLSRRILLMDGAMGTMIQDAGLDDSAYHGERFANHAQALKGNNDILNLTKPDLIASIHRGFLESGADFLETNTRNNKEFCKSNLLLQNQPCRFVQQ